MILSLQHQIQQLSQQQNNLLQNNAQSVQQRDNMPRGKDSKPRGRMTAYAFFVQTCRQEHKKKHPEEKIVFREFSKKCAMRWKVRNVYNFICYCFTFSISRSIFRLRIQDAKLGSDKKRRNTQYFSNKMFITLHNCYECICIFVNMQCY